MTKNIESLLKQVADSTTAVIGVIRSIDARIETLNAERQALGDASVSRAEFLGHLAASIDVRTERFGSVIGGQIRQVNRSFFALENGVTRLNLLTHDASLPVVMTEEACLYYLKPIIMARLEEVANCMEFPGTEEAVPIEKRRKLIGGIDAEIQKLRAERNELARQLQELGVVG